MAVSFIPASGATAEAAAAASITFTLPAGFTVGDNDYVMFLCSTNGSSVALTATPTGAVALSTSGSVYGATTATTTYAYYRKLISGVDVPGTTTYTFTRSGTGDWQGVLGCYRGVDTTTPIRGVPAFTTEGDVANGTLIPTVLTGLSTGDMVVFGLGARGNGTYSSYVNMTDVGQAMTSGTNKRPQGQTYLAITAGGSAPSAQASFSVTANAHGEHSIAFAAAPSGTIETLRPDAILEQTNDTKTLADLQRDVP